MPDPSTIKTTGSPPGSENHPSGSSEHTAEETKSQSEGTAIVQCEVHAGTHVAEPSNSNISNISNISNVSNVSNEALSPLTKHGHSSCVHAQRRQSRSLRAISRARKYPLEIYQEFQGLPSVKFSSDHVSLYADFALQLAPSVGLN